MTEEMEKLLAEFFEWRREVDGAKALDCFDLALGFSAGRGLSAGDAIDFAVAARDRQGETDEP